ncbi:hypothetical protein V8G54_021265 [Vigna mungo]|uniref:Pentatricopeptide repeat-containing protein n=1 Tax=Vigna mungo TaxID=3915 RepID=A0AAQ3ND75_VIGMU
MEETRGSNVRTSFVKLARTNCVEEEGGITESHEITYGGLLLWNKRFHSEQSASLDFTVWRRGFSSSSTKEDDDLEDGFSELDTPADDENEIGNLLASDAGQSDDDSDEENVEEPHNEVDEVVKEKGKPHRGRVQSELFNEIMHAPGLSIGVVVDNWLAEGNELTRDEVSHAMFLLRRLKMFGRALQVFELSLNCLYIMSF